MTTIILLSQRFLILSLCLYSAPQSNASPPPPVSFPLTSEQIETYVKGHNNVRANVGVPPIKWDTELAEVAENIGQSCQFVSGPERFDGDDLGVNVYRYSYDGFFEIHNVIAAWEEEEKYFDYGTNRCKEGARCSDYTQMVWKNSTEFGCSPGFWCNDDTLPIWYREGPYAYYSEFVCVYRPAGNIPDQRPY